MGGKPIVTGAIPGVVVPGSVSKQLYLQTVRSHPMWGLEIELGSSEEQQVLSPSQYQLEPEWSYCSPRSEAQGPLY